MTLDDKGLSGEFELEECYSEYYEVFTPKNIDYKTEELYQKLSCSYCPPNRGENAKPGSLKRKNRQPKQKHSSSNLNKQRQFKNRNK